MSRLSKLDISNIRNIEKISLDLSPHINLIYGENGSGKTSILEAIYLLASGRSFRSSKIEPLVREEENEAVIYVELENEATAGFLKTRRKPHQLKLNGELQKNWDRVARELPVQILDANSFSLLEGGPKARRRFLDWGVFHVEPSFVSNWRKTRKCLANRNFLLKKSAPDDEQLRAWDAELGAAAEAVHEARQAYFDNFRPVFERVFDSLVDTGGNELSLSYEKGWDEDKKLEEALLANRQMDAKYGATQNGPHRADIVVRKGKRPAIEVLSRGQQKILVSALKIAQGILLSEATDRQCIYLVDDLAAELDPTNRAKVLNSLLDLGGQLFITSVELEALQNGLYSGPEMATFHVERGIITG